MESFSRKFIVSTVIVGALLESASANVTGNDTQNFNATISNIDFITVHSSQTLGNGWLGVTFFADQAKNVLPPTRNLQGQEVTSEDTLIFSELGLGYGLTHNLEVGVHISHLLSQETDRTEPGAQFDKAGLNEIRGSLKYRLIEQELWGAAFLTSMNFNQVKSNPFLGEDPGETLNVELAIDRRWGPSVVAFNIGYRFRQGGDPIPDSLYEPLDDSWIGSIGYSQKIRKSPWTYVFEVYGAGASTDHDEGSRWAAELIGGVKYALSRGPIVQGGLGTQISDGLFAPESRFFLGVHFDFDLLHRQPSINLFSSSVESTTYSGFLPSDIREKARLGFDKLIEEQEFVLRKSINHQSIQDEKPPFEVVRLEGFEFDFASAEIRKRHHHTLRDLKNYLESPPEVLKVRIEGHTDSSGHVFRNQRLSLARANAIRDYLHEQGLREDILVETIGYGSDKPIYDNKVEVEAKFNRRVEVRIIRQVNVSVEKMNKRIVDK